MGVNEKVLTARMGSAGSHTLEVCRANGGYRALEKARAMTPQAIVDEVKASNLRGRGGAGFPTGKKWEFLPPQGEKPRYLCINADESEPGTFKDRLLLEKDPHLVLEGIAIACRALGVKTAFIYIRGEFVEPYLHLRLAVEDAEKAGLLDVELVVHRGAGAYICGEETALLESLEGRKGFPRLKPPFPAISGLYQCPTIINNVETMACIPPIIERGGKRFASLGSPEDGGPRLYSLSGHVNRPGVHELPSGTVLRELIYEHGGGIPGGRALKAVIPGGSSSAPLTPDEIDVRMDVPSLAKAGTMLGSSGVIVMDDTTCLVEAAGVVADFYAHESCGQCTPCREGTIWHSKALHRITDGGGRKDDVALLLDLCRQMWGNTICPLSDGAVMPLRGFLTKFAEEFTAHVRDHRCPAGRCFQ